MEKCKELFRNYKELILYVFFGGLTTVVNWVGYWLLADLLHVPYLWATAIAQIAANAGVEGAVVLEKVSSNESANYGYDAATETYGDMISMGIVDPTKVCRSALENAASVSAMVLTTESLVADIPEKNVPAAPAGGDMGGMY